MSTFTETLHNLARRPGFWLRSAVASHPAADRRREKMAASLPERLSGERWAEKDEPILVVEGLEMIYCQPNGCLPVLSGLSFQVQEGEFLCLVGTSGHGKSTLLRLIAGLEKPTAGRIRLAGERMDRPRRSVGIVFQEPTLMSWRTVEANVTLPLDVAGVPPEETRRKAQALIDLVGLSGFEDVYPAQLSGGMAQRVALARALVHEPQILLLDEPFGALDALTRERMGQELLRIWRAHRKTVVMVTHSVSEAVFLADRVLVLGLRPAAIVDEVRVDLPRPRTPDVLETPAFGALAHRVREAIDRTTAPVQPPA